MRIYLVRVPRFLGAIIRLLTGMSSDRKEE
jgi:hypothetical protein